MKRQIAKTSSLAKFSQAYGFLMDQQDEQMGLIYGSPGVGKSTAAKYIASQEGGIFVTCSPASTPNSLINQILTALGTDPGRSFAASLNKAIEQFKLRQVALFVDEADYLCDSPALLDVVRSIHDQAEIPCLLIGMTGIYRKLERKKLLVDRIQIFLDVPLCSQEDTKLIASARCQVQLDAELIEFVHQSAKGNARQIKRMLAHIESLALANELQIVTRSDWGNRDLLPAGSAAPAKARRVV